MAEPAFSTPTPESLGEFSTLQDIIAHLRSPEGGCPWDRQQTHSSLRESLLQECYEVLEALDEADPKKLSQELGDLLLQIVLHARIASEAGEFELEDVLRGISAKLIRRHPHVFGSDKLHTAQEVLDRWEHLKKNERAADASILSSVPRHMPALAYSQEIQERVARVGFDWKEEDDILDKLAEEIAEIKQAESQQEKEAEFGDLLFVLVNIIRRQGVDVEVALRGTNERFRRRFAWMETACRERGQSMEKLSFEQLNKMWEEAKKQTNKKQKASPEG